MSYDLSDFWDDLKRPINIISLLLAIIGIILAFFFYFKSEQRREISYRFVSRTKVYDRSSSSPKLSLLNADKSPVRNDVYVVSIQIWNSGTLPIENVDMRRPFDVVLLKGDGFLDWRVAYSLQDADVCKFRITPTETNIPITSLNLEWDHFDPLRGCQVQILFMGDTNTAVSLADPFSGNGNIKGTGQINPIWKPLAAIEAIGVVLCGVMFMYGMFRVSKRAQFISKFERNVIYSSLAGLYLFLGLLLGLYFGSLFSFKTSNPFPPDVPVSFKASENPK